MSLFPNGFREEDGRLLASVLRDSPEGDLPEPVTSDQLARLAGFGFIRPFCDRWMITAEGNAAAFAFAKGWYRDGS